MIILPNSVISHDAVIGDYSCITGGVCLSGLVTMRHNCHLGTNSSYHQRGEDREWLSDMYGSGDQAQRPRKLGDGWESGQAPTQNVGVHNACTL